MSQENVEVVRRSLEAYRRGDLDAALARLHPEIVWSPYTVREDKMVRMEEFIEREEALEAAGLPE